MLGLFAHIVLMWKSPWGVQVHGLFYHAPAHDIPALLAFVTSLMTAVNFVTSVEVNFYEKYRIYFNLLHVCYDRLVQSVVCRIWNVCDRE